MPQGCVNILIQTDRKTEERFSKALPSTEFVGVCEQTSDYGCRFGRRQRTRAEVLERDDVNFLIQY